MVYKFLDYGVFYTLSYNLYALYEFLDEKDGGYFENFETGEEHDLSNGIYFFRFDYFQSYHYEYVCIDCEESELQSNILKSTNNAPNPDDLKICSSLNKNIWTKLVGPSADCNDYFNDKARIKVKVWNQNYGIYSSLGISVANQYKNLGVWWRNKTEELELGYVFASFKYPGVKMNWPQNQSIWIEYDGYKLDQYGMIVSTNKHPSSFFTSFPISDKDKTVLRIYAWNPFSNQNVIELSGKDVNKIVKDLTKEAGDAVWSYLRKELGEQPTVIISSNYYNDIEFTYTNWKSHKKNEGKITEIFDWNTGQIGFKYNFDGNIGWNNVDYTKIMTAKTYKEARILCYGMGRRGTKWAGARVDFKDKN